MLLKVDKGSFKGWDLMLFQNNYNLSDFLLIHKNTEQLIHGNTPFYTSWASFYDNS